MIQLLQGSVWWGKLCILQFEKPYGVYVTKIMKGGCWQQTKLLQQ